MCKCLSWACACLNRYNNYTGKTLYRGHLRAGREVNKVHLRIPSGSETRLNLGPLGVTPWFPTRFSQRHRQINVVLCVEKWNRPPVCLDPFTKRLHERYQGYQRKRGSPTRPTQKPRFRCLWRLRGLLQGKSSDVIEATGQDVTALPPEPEARPLTQRQTGSRGSGRFGGQGATPRWEWPWEQETDPLPYPSRFRGLWSGRRGSTPA